MSTDTTAPDTHEVFSRQQQARQGNRSLTELTDGDGDYCVLHCTLPPGVIVPLHSHADRETFYIVQGRAEAFLGDHWQTLGPGQVFDAKDGIKHAWRNSSDAAVVMLCVTTMRMGRFLRDAAVASGSADPAKDAQRFLDLIQAHGYWLATPDENAAIGLVIHWG